MRSLFRRVLARNRSGRFCEARYPAVAAAAGQKNRRTLADVDEVVIAFRPEDERGREILDGLPQRIEMQSVHESADGTRRYHLVGEDVDLDSLEPELDRIDANWRSHISAYRESDS